MTLPAPNLDDRRFQDLVDDAMRHVQASCPEWTDHNASDPGVTLIETFAYMIDQLLYRLNRVPDRLYIKFLDLVGIRLRPPSAARVPITFWLSAALPTTVTLNAATRVATLRSDSEQAVIFSTVRDLDIPPCELVEAVVVPADGGEPAAAPILDGLRARVSAPIFTAVPQPGDALYLGLSNAVPRCIVRVEFEGHVEGIGVDPKNPPLQWEAWTGSGWQACSVCSDETGGFNTHGAVLVQLPERHERSVVSGQAAAWLRVRLVAAEEGQPSYRSAPIVDALNVSTAGGTQDAIHADIVEAEELGISEGVPGQSFALSRKPVLRLGDVAIETSSDDGWLSWEEVETFAASTAEDRHFMIDHVAGQIHFGPAVRDANGTFIRHGAVPEHGAVVRVRDYAVGGGRIGNVSAGAVATLRSSLPFIARVENLRAAQGGTEGETLEEAKLRAPMAIRTRGRAVTRDDYEYFAREAAPEAARIVCAPGADGDAAVRVLVVPAAASSGSRIEFEDLVPREDVLRRIAERLDEVRLIGARVSVEPPRYRGVTVVARVRVRARADEDTVHAAAVDALYRFLNPLPGGGPDGGGWPFGRPVQAGELHAVLQRVTGVDLVEDVRLFSADPVTGERGGETARLEIDRHSLVFSFDHHVRVQR